MVNKKTKIIVSISVVTVSVIVFLIYSIMLIIQQHDNPFSVNSIRNTAIIVLSTLFATICISALFIYKTTSIRTRLDELRNLDKVKDELLSVIKHEFKTPLFPILGYSEMLSKYDNLGMLNEKQKKAVDQIYRNAKRLEKLTDKIVDAEALSTGKMSFKLKKLSAMDVIDLAKANFLLHPNLKDIQFDVVVQTSSFLNSDKERLMQIFDYIVENAVDFVPNENGRIEIGAYDKKEDVIFYVKDNGSGIPKEMQSNVFKRFYQVDASKTRKHDGAGLGLSICQGIIQSLGGKIWLESEGRKETIFYFSIPKSNANATN